MAQEEEEEELLDQLEEAFEEALELFEGALLGDLLLEVVQQQLEDLRSASDLDQQPSEYLEQTGMDSQRMQGLRQSYLVVLVFPGWESPP